MNKNFKKIIAREGLVILGIIALLSGSLYAEQDWVNKAYWNCAQGIQSKSDEGMVMLYNICHKKLRDILDRPSGPFISDINDITNAIMGMDIAVKEMKRRQTHPDLIKAYECR